PTGGGEWADGPSYDATGNPFGVDLQTAGFCYQILPYIEQDNLYKLTDITLAAQGRPVLASGSAQYPVGSYVADYQKINPWTPASDGSGRSSVGPLTSTGAANNLFLCPSRRQGMQPGWRGVKNDYAAVV